MTDVTKQTFFYAYRSTDPTGQVRFFPAPVVTPGEGPWVTLDSGQAAMERRGPFDTWQEAHDEARRWEGRPTWAQMAAARAEMLAVAARLGLRRKPPTSATLHPSHRSPLATLWHLALGALFLVSSPVWGTGILVVLVVATKWEAVHRRRIGRRLLGW